MPQNQFWGVRCGIVQDPFGFRWSLATVTENLSPGQLQGRIDDFMARGGITDSFGEETGNPERVLDGDLQAFIEAQLRLRASKQAN